MERFLYSNRLLSGMWVAKFKLKDDEDIYSPLCEKYGVNLFAYPYTFFTKKNTINLMAGAAISGSDLNKQSFID